MNFFQIFLTSDGHQPANMRTNATCSAIDLNNQLDNPNDVQHHQLKQAGSIITQQPDHRHHPEQRINRMDRCCLYPIILSTTTTITITTLLRTKTKISLTTTTTTTTT